MAGDERDDLDGCAAVLDSTDYVSDDDLPYVALFAGVPPDRIDDVAAQWRTIFDGVPRADHVAHGRRLREL